MIVEETACSLALQHVKESHLFSFYELCLNAVEDNCLGLRPPTLSIMPCPPPTAQVVHSAISFCLRASVTLELPLRFEVALKHNKGETEARLCISCQSKGH